MAITICSHPHITVDTESERSTGWPDGARVYCKDTKKKYVLDAVVFQLFGTRVTVGITAPDSPLVGELWVDTN